MWKASKVMVKDLEYTLNRLEEEGWEILSVTSTPGYDKHDMVVVAQKENLTYRPAFGEGFID